jgi:hypothetical protein
MSRIIVLIYDEVSEVEITKAICHPFGITAPFFSTAVTRHVRMRARLSAAEWQRMKRRLPIVHDKLRRRSNDSELIAHFLDLRRLVLHDRLQLCDGGLKFLALLRDGRF